MDQKTFTGNEIETVTPFWNNDEVLASTVFEDNYFSVDDGPGESRYVFIDSNDLSSRFEKCEEFTIIETGFGTGLNFLLTWENFLKNAPKNAKLNFYSVEKFPITPESLPEIYSKWDFLSYYTSELIAAYPEPSKGIHQVSFENGRINLFLLFEDVTNISGYFSAKADALFLDGFSPKLNPDMWNEKLFSDISKLTKPGGTFATFTAAGIVKRGLRGNGFEVKRIKGFGRKNHMLQGVFVGNENVTPRIG